MSSNAPFQSRVLLIFLEETVPADCVEQAETCRLVDCSIVLCCFVCGSTVRKYILYYYYYYYSTVVKILFIALRQCHPKFMRNDQNDSHHRHVVIIAWQRYFLQNM